jgi:hypothetical protein
MDTCAVETGLLKKKPCGQAAATKCLNCEVPLCSKHAVPELNARKLKTGKYLCEECNKAQRAAEKRMGSVEGEPMASKPPEAAKPAAAKPAPVAAKPAAAAAKPAAPAAARPAPAAGKPAAAPAKPEPAHDDVDAPLEFNPTKKP